AATNLVLNGGTLQYTGGTVSTDRLFSVGTAGGTIDASGSGAVNFTNTGSMAFNGQTGTRTLTLTGTNTNANTIAAVIGDNGGATSVAKTGTGEWVLSGTNTYTGTTNITGGTLQIAGAANTTWLGSNTGGAVNISGSGTLDLGGVTASVVNFGAKQFNISGAGAGGNGAITNSSTVIQTNAFQSVALTGDATIGGGDGSSNTQNGRWDIRGGSATLALGNNTLTKTGSNQVSIVAGTISGNGNIVVNQGELAIQTGTFAQGTGTFTFNGGTTLGLWNNTAGRVTTAMAFIGANTVLNESGASTINSNMTINGTTNFDIESGTSLTLAGQLGGAGTILLNGANSNTYSTSNPYTGTLALGANQIFNSTLDLAGGTLALNGFNLNVSTLHITGNSTIDFGSGLASILDTTNFIIDPGITLTITNWANAVDYFYSSNNPGLTSLSQIVFDPPTYTGSDTKWLNYADGPDNDHQITPVPEPATYGAFFTAVALVLFFWQRRRLRPIPVAA
ncbi:MAG TPA: autotransporter-associated beta strand repeat-containing protein, partial [Opitutaceae bacterium]|nr:autotransporter-associated beta strand repeat-containing protein [Opitutaceae bacterium]